MRVNLSVAIVAMTDTSTNSNPDTPVSIMTFYWESTIKISFIFRLTTGPIKV